MTSTVELIESIKHKRTCRYCKAKKLETHDSEKVENFAFYHCFNCGADFIEDKEQREYRDDDKKDDSPWGAGFIVLLAMVSTILVIKVADQENATFGGNERSQNAIELLNNR